MYTVCPKCALTLVVTAADLRVAQGYVRCGRCSSVFNALAQLSDERAAARNADSPPSPPQPEPEPEPEPTTQAQEPASTATASPREEAIPEDALEFNPERADASSVFVAAPPNPEWTAATGSFKALVAANQEAVTPDTKPDAADEDVNVELDAALLSDIVKNAPRPTSVPGPAAPPREAPPAATAPARRRTGLKPAVAAAAAAAMREAEGAAPATVAVAHEAPSTPREQRAAPAAEPPAHEEAAGEDFAPLEPAARLQLRFSPRLWAAGAALLALALVAQLINHQRDTLATDPRFSRPLTALYASLGVPLMPHWDLHAYDVRQLGATVAPGAAAGGTGTITVRASIRNNGARPQPLPLLRVTLQDRFGNRIASRDVLPRDYLPRSIAPTALLSADQRIDAELAFVDPGSSAVGFELDACLPVRGGVACANDSSVIR